MPLPNGFLIDGKDMVNFLSLKKTISNSTHTWNMKNIATNSLTAISVHAQKSSTKFHIQAHWE